MTTSTRRIELGLNTPRRRVAGFTLVEVMIATTISTIVLAGILSAFVLMGRTGFAASSYSELEAQTRRALDTFGKDARKASNIRWNSAQSITLTVVLGGSATSQVTYAYDASAQGATAGCFYRVLGDAASTEPRRILIRNVAADFSFQRFKLERPGIADNTAVTDLETKQIQVNLRANRTGAATLAANQSAVSARYILRNKSVSN